MQDKNCDCLYARNHRSLRNEVLFDFIEYIKLQLLQDKAAEVGRRSVRKNSFSGRYLKDLKRFITDRVNEIRLSEINDEVLEHLFPNEFCPAGRFIPPSEYSHNYKEDVIRKVMARESILKEMVDHEVKAFKGLGIAESLGL